LHTLIILLYAQRTGSTANNVAVQFNNDGGADYDCQWFEMQDTARTGVRQAAQTAFNCPLSSPSTVDPPTFAVTRIEVPNYGSTAANKSGVFQAGAFNGTTAGDTIIRQGQIRWRGTAALNRVTITDTLKAGSRLVILGF